MRKLLGRIGWTIIFWWTKVEIFICETAKEHEEYYKNRQRYNPFEDDMFI